MAIVHYQRLLFPSKSDIIENDFQSQSLSISGRLAGVNGFLCERFLLSFPANLARRQESVPAKTCSRLISFTPLVYPRCAGVKTLAD